MKLQIKRSEVAIGGEALPPSLPDLLEGELALNYNSEDPALFIKLSDGSLFKFPLGDAIFSGDYNDLINKPTIGNGALVIKNADGTTNQTYTANQVEDAELVLPKGFSGDYGDLINAPGIGDGKLSILESNGNNLGDFYANQDSNTTINLPEPFSGDYNDLANKPSIPAPANDATIVVTQGGDARGQFTLNQPNNYAFDIDPIPDLSSYVKEAPQDGVLYGRQNSAWAAVPIFSGDWNDISNKPDLTINDGQLKFIDADNLAAGTFTANQAGDTQIQLPRGFSGDYNDLINQPAINDATLLIKNSDGSVNTSFTANSADNKELVLPKGFTGSYDDLTDKPDPPSNAEISVTEGGVEVGSFTLNQPNNAALALSGPPTIGEGILSIKRGAKYYWSILSKLNR